VTQLYSRHLYALINYVLSLNYWVVLSEESRGGPLFWQQLPRLRFEADIWPLLLGLSIMVATDASDFAWGGHTMVGPMEIAPEYFSEWEAREFSTYRELLRVCRYLQAMVHMCEGRFVVLQVDAMNLPGIVNRGSSKLGINELARELFWFSLRHNIYPSVEWVPREENAFADDISKMLIPEDWMLSQSYFSILDARWGPHSMDLFASNDINQSARFFSLHWCRGVACGHPCLRTIAGRRKLLEHWPLQCGGEGLEDPTATQGASHDANPSQGINPLVLTSVPGLGSFI